MTYAYLLNNWTRRAEARRLQTVEPESRIQTPDPKPQPTEAHSEDLFTSQK